MNSGDITYINVFCSFTCSVNVIEVIKIYSLNTLAKISLTFVELLFMLQFPIFEHKAVLSF